MRVRETALCATDAVKGLKVLATAGRSCHEASNRRTPSVAAEPPTSGSGERFWQRSTTAFEAGGRHLRSTSESTDTRCIVITLVCVRLRKHHRNSIIGCISTSSDHSSVGRREVLIRLIGEFVVSELASFVCNCWVRSHLELEAVSCFMYAAALDSARSGFRGLETNLILCSL